MSTPEGRILAGIADIAAAAWDACVSTETRPDGKTAYGVRLSYDGSTVALCGAVIPQNGPARVSIIDLQPTGRGTQWLADWLNARSGKAIKPILLF